MRRYTRAAPAALNVFALATDDVTGLSVQQLNKDNAIIDFVNSPDNAAGIDHFQQLFINNLDTGVAFFSSNSSPTTAGRTLPGPIPISVGAAAAIIMGGDKAKELGLSPKFKIKSRAVA